MSNSFQDKLERGGKGGGAYIWIGLYFFFNLTEGHSQGLKLPNYNAINNPAEQIKTYIAEFLYEKTH